MKTVKKTAGWLVMAAALVLGMTACSSEDNAAEEPQQPVEAVKTYTLTVVASMGGATTTRALTYDSETKTLNATWAEGEEVQVYSVTNPGTMTETETNVATLKAQSSGATTTLTGQFKGTYKPAAGDVLRLRFNPNPDYTHQEGTLDYIAKHCDYANAEITVESVDASGNATATGTAEFVNQQAIVKFSLKQPDGTTPLAVTSLTVKVGNTTYNVKPTAASSDIYVAIKSASGKDVTLTATDADADSYSYTKSHVTFAVGKYYALSVKMTADHPYVYNINLSYLSAGEYYAPNYTILTGTLSSECKIFITDGATVKLKDVTIPGGFDNEMPWAGITCLGNATIRLSGVNIVKGYYYHYPGIQAGGSNTTLTIEGSGTLTAVSGRNGMNPGIGAGIGGGGNQEVGNIEIKGGYITANGGNGCAGIGGSSGGRCGNITISGGTIISTGGYYGAGIGSGCGKKDYPSHCGNITISGGNVTAIGGDCAAGIGSGDGTGHYSDCGNITITGGAITATGGTNKFGDIYMFGAGIGCGSNGDCGNITISGTTTGTATGGTGCTYDIGPGYNCPPETYGTISVAAGTIRGTHPQ